MVPEQGGELAAVRGEAKLAQEELRLARKSKVEKLLPPSIARRWLQAAKLRLRTASGPPRGPSLDISRQGLD